MTITIEPKEIAELIELLALRDSAKEKDTINKLGEFVAENFNHAQDWFVVMEKWFRYLDGKINIAPNTTSSVAPAAGQKPETI